MHRLIVFFSTILCGTVIVAAQAGYVVEAKGTWILNGSTKLSASREVPFSGRIIRRSDSADDRLRIADLRGVLIVKRDCSTGNCSAPIVLPRNAPPGLLERSRSLLIAIFGRGWFSGPQDDSNQARSSSLVDGVVESKDGWVGLAPVLTPLGEQYLRWRPIASGTPGDWSRPVKLAKPATITGLSPALYQMELMRTNGTSFEPLGSALALVCASSDYEAKRTSFAEARSIVQKWADDVEPETKRRFLQAALELLAQ